MRMTAISAGLLLAVAAVPVLAADASIDQVYSEAKSGDIDGALNMMGPVLKDHPNSAKAHYVEAELLAKASRLGEARDELAKAKSLDPGLAGISSHSVRELEAKLNSPTGLVPATGSTYHPVAVAPQRGGISWGVIILIALVLFFVLALVRRRSQTTVVGGFGGGPTVVQPGYGPGPGYGGGPGYAPGYGAGYGGGVGGGMGSGLMGSLASGAAMGAGFAVGEEVVDHLMGDHGERGYGSGGMGGGYADNQQPMVDPDADMGGNDFGIADSGSWDDSSGGGGGDDGGW